MEAKVVSALAAILQDKMAGVGGSIALCRMGVGRMARPARVWAVSGGGRQCRTSQSTFTLSRSPQRMDVRMLAQYSQLAKTGVRAPFPNPTLFARTLVRFSKKGKMKTVKAVAKRFKITASGKVKHWRSGRNHKHLNKSKRARRLKRKAVYCNKTQAKMIKKMLNR